MRRLTILLSIVTFVLTFVSFNERAEAQYMSSPQLFSETSYDFKGIPRYTKPRHSFIFTNNSQSDLRLVAVRTSCQCTQVYIPTKRVFKSGEKGEVVAEIDAVRFTGSRHATVTVTFEQSGRTFEVPLNVVGVVLENVRVEPNKLNFLVDEIKSVSDDSNSAQANRSQRATVFYPSNETVVRAECANPHVEVQIGQPVRSGGGTQTPLVVSIKESAPAGYINAVVRLWSNGMYSSSPVTLNVSGSVRAQLSVSPSTLTFSTSKNGDKITKNIVVTASKEFVLKTVECESKAIECNLSQKAIRPARVCVIPITFDPSKLQAESTLTRVKIETVDGRVLYLTAQISSGNFAIRGIKEIELPVADYFATNSEESKVVVSGNPPVAESSIAVSGNPVSEVPSGFVRPGTAPATASQAPNAIRPYAGRPTSPSFGLPFAPFGGVFQ